MKPGVTRISMILHSYLEYCAVSRKHGKDRWIEDYFLLCRHFIFQYPHFRHRVICKPFEVQR